ncbi:MAG: hypothetical protein WKF89_10855 [Chitinophagaceae bacterium]
MEKELYFDIASEIGAGALYLITSNDNNKSFYYHYCSSDLETDRVENTESNYADFTDFWKHFISDKNWHCLHPLYIHPELRIFIKQQLDNISWRIVKDDHWRVMYQRQWNKVLNNPAEYYKPVR